MLEQFSSGSRLREVLSGEGDYVDLLAAHTLHGQKVLECIGGKSRYLERIFDIVRFKSNALNCAFAHENDTGVLAVMDTEH